MTNDKAYKADKGKLRFDLISPEFTKAVAGVLTFGAEKYGPNNWQNLEDPTNRYYAALLRHLNAFHAGEKYDKESGMSHLAHAATNIMFLMHFTQSENKAACEEHSAHCAPKQKIKDKFDDKDLGAEHAALWAELQKAILDAMLEELR